MKNNLFFFRQIKKNCNIATVNIFTLLQIYIHINNLIKKTNVKHI